MTDETTREEAGTSWRQELQEKRHQTRAALLRLLDVLASLDVVAPEDLARLRDAVQHLSSLFYLVVLGEFNAGKSAFINGLLGANLMPEGVTPTTTKIHLLTYGPEPISRARQDEVVEWTYPAEWLNGVYLVDTPGTNSLFRQHEELARRFIHWADLVFFVMAANRAFAETDRVFLDLIREFRSKVILIINQIDLLTGDDELERVKRYVAATFRKVAGFDVEIYAVSARLAQEAGQAQGDRQMELWAKSGFQPVCDIIRSVLGEEERARQSILTSARIGLWAIEHYDAPLDARIEAWHGERTALDDVARQWDAFARESDTSRQRYLAEMQSTVGEIQDLADQRLQHDYSLGQIARGAWRWALRVPLGRLGRPPGDAQPSRDARPSRDNGVQSGQLERFLRVDAPEQLETILSRHNGELRREGERLLASSLEHLTARLAADAGPLPGAELKARLIGKIEVPDEQRNELIDVSDSRRQVEQLLGAAGIPAFVQRWGEWARSAWWQMIVWEVAVIIVAWIAGAFVHAFVDQQGRVIGYIAASAVAVGLIGLLILPWRRFRARRQLAVTISRVHEALAASLSEHTSALVARYRAAFDAAVTPYRRAIDTEESRLQETSQSIEEVGASLRDIEAELAGRTTT